MKSFRLLVICLLTVVMLSLTAVPAWTAAPLPAQNNDITSNVYTDVNGNSKINNGNAGVAKTGTICGYVFYDENGDRKWNKGEDGIAAPGYLILCRDDPGDNQPVDMNNPTAVTSPDENGYYSFTGLLPGTYTVFAIFGADWPCITDDTVTITLKKGKTINLYKKYGVFGVVYKAP